MKRAALICFITLITAFAATATAQMRVEVALRAAMELETVKGDLKGAITAYQKIVDGYPESRAIRAQALVRMAECYLKLGDAQATEVYERVVREFPDQSEAVAAARAKLVGGSAKKAAAELTIRRLALSPEVIDAISDDGTKSLETDWTTGNIMVRDLGTGHVRPVTSQPQGAGADYDEWGESAIFSPDGSHAAYVWCATAPKAAGPSTSRCDGQLRIVRINGAAPEKPRVLYAAGRWAQPYDWSADGKSIAAHITKHDGSEQVTVVSVADGSARIIKTLGNEKSGSKSAGSPRTMKFSPDGRYLAFDVAPLRAQRREAGEVFVMPASGGAEVPVASSPANDLVAGWSPDGAQLLLTSDRNSTVDLYGIRMVAGKPEGRPVVLRADLASASVALVSSSGALYYTVQTGGGSHIQLATVDFTSAAVMVPPALAGEPLPGSTVSPQWTPDGSELLTLLRRNAQRNSRTSVLLRSATTGAVREIQPDLTAFQPPRWGKDPNVFYTIGTNGRGDVGLFSVDLRTGGTSLLRKGTLTQLRITPDGRRAQFFHTSETQHHFIERELSSGVERELVAFISRGIPANGQVSVDGKKLYYRKPHEGAKPPAPASALIERDLQTGAERVLLEGNLGGIFLSPEGRHLAVPENDPAGKWRSIRLLATGGEAAPRDLMRIESGLGLNVAAWAPDGRSILLTRVLSGGPQESWWVPISGGTAKQLSHFIGTPAIHPDGRRVALTVANAQPRRFEIWAMEHFLPRPGAKGTTK